MSTKTEYIREQLKDLPSSPGVYIFKDDRGSIIYVGKSYSLDHRVKSYFTSPQKQTDKTQRLVENIADLEYFITKSEEEALILEYNLIQRHQPYYNVRLKDGKSYPYLKISTNEEWPRMFVTRHMEEDGGRYFGPFSSARSLKETVNVIKGIFPLRSCTKTITGKEERPCLKHHIHLCPAPCIGAITKKEYADTIRQVVMFLEGKQERIVRSLQARMEKASDSMQYEKAATLRDQIQSIERVIESQKIATKVKGEQDVIAFVTERDKAYVQVFFIRGSKLIGRDGFTLQGVESEEPEQIMTEFVKQFYSSASYVPPLLLLQYEVEDKSVIENWLLGKRGSKVKIEVPARGNKKQLVEIVAENAVQSHRQQKLKHQATAQEITEGLAEIEKALALPRPPERMECYDISNIQGKSAVGSMVVFEKGKPNSSHYRRFKINTVRSADDYAMLGEVIRRRVKRLATTDSESESGYHWSEVPDLILIDGGKGQLNAVLAAMKESGVESVPVASIAKEHEEIFLPGKARPVVLPANSPGLMMLQRLRDEAHRFAIRYHRSLRSKQTVKSALDSIPGVGPKRRRTLIKEFGSVRAIRQASVEELAKVKGITPLLAQQIKEGLDYPQRNTR